MTRIGTRTDRLSHMRRRRWLKGCLAVPLGIAAMHATRAVAAAQAPRDAFAANTFAEALGALRGPGAAMPTPSARITLAAPAVADDGAFVPIAVTSELPGTREIVLLFDGNPQPAAVAFTIPAGTEPYVATRIRMATSGVIHAVVRSDDGLFIASRAVEVVAGACG